MFYLLNEEDSMTKSDLFKFILSKGYRTHDEVMSHFEGVDHEIIEAHIEGLINKKMIGKATYHSEKGDGYLYWALR